MVPPISVWDRDTKVDTLFPDKKSASSRVNTLFERCNKLCNATISAHHIIREMFGVKSISTYSGNIYPSLPGEEWMGWTRLVRIYR